MTSATGDTRAVRIPLPVAKLDVGGLVRIPPDAHACYVMAHGAGAGMTHPFLGHVAEGLAAAGVATLRYQFPFMERASRRPDRPELAHEAVRAAVRAAAQAAPGLPLVAGGKSFGGRMTSQAQAADPLPGVAGIAFLGFPLHPAEKPDDARAAHLADVAIPMLFLQGDDDALASLALLAPVVDRLAPRATLVVLPGADHAFHVPKRSGRTDADVLRDVVDAMAAWIAPLVRADASAP